MPPYPDLSLVLILGLVVAAQLICGLLAYVMRRPSLAIFGHSIVSAAATGCALATALPPGVEVFAWILGVVTAATGLYITLAAMRRGND